MNKETVPIHQLILGLFTTIPTPINIIGFWSLVEYFQKETNTQLTGSYEYITLYTPGKYIEYDYGNGCWKFKKDYSLNSIINVDEKEQTIREYFQTLAGNRVNNFFQSFNKEKYKTYQEELLKAGKIKVLNQANILLISDREEDYKVLLEYGFRNINWLKSYSRANNFFEKYPWYLTQHHIIILGNQNERPNTDAFYRTYPLDEKIRRQARDQNTIVATLEVENLSDGSISFQSDITDAYHGYTHKVSGKSYQELLASILEVFSNVPTKPRKFYRIPNYTNPIKIPLPTMKKDLKVCYAIFRCSEFNTATTGINVTPEEDNNFFKGIVKSKLGDFDITIAKHLNSKELLTMAKGSTEQCKDTGRQLTLFVTYEIPYHPNPNAIIIRYRFGGELAKDTEIHEVEFNTPFKPNKITNNAHSFSRANAILGAATHIYNNALKELGLPTIKDLNTPSAHGIELKSAEESETEYRNNKKTLEDFAITVDLAEAYLKSRYKPNLKNLSIRSTQEGITITKYYEPYGETTPLCAVTFKKDCYTNHSYKLAVQALKESGILSASQEVYLAINDIADSTRPTERQQSSINLINQDIFEQLYGLDNPTYNPKNPSKKKKMVNPN